GASTAGTGTAEAGTGTDTAGVHNTETGSDITGTGNPEAGSGTTGASTAGTGTAEAGTGTDTAGVHNTETGSDITETGNPEAGSGTTGASTAGTGTAEAGTSTDTAEVHNTETGSDITETGNPEAGSGTTGTSSGIADAKAHNTGARMGAAGAGLGMVGAGSGKVGAGPGVVGAGERGRTTVSDRAVRRIAEHAAREALPPGDVGAVNAKVGTRGGRATVSVVLALPYRAGIARSGHRVRRHVARRTAALTGLAVARPRVRVRALTPPAGSWSGGPAAPATRGTTGGPARRPWSERRVPAALAALVAGRKVSSHVIVGDPRRQHPRAHAMNVGPVRVSTGFRERPDRPSFAHGTPPSTTAYCHDVHDIARRTRGQQDFDGRGTGG
ncbi:hypothetical protein ABT245_29330, partial [Streptomyces sp. NPDC001508]